MTTEIPQPSVNPIPYTPTFEPDMATFMTWLYDNASKFGLVAAEINAALNLSLLGTTATSTTTLAISAPGTTFPFVTQLNKGFAIGMVLKLASTASPDNYMKVEVLSYNTLNGVVSCKVKSYGGSGSASSWSVFFDVPDTVSGYVPIGGLIANKNLGNSFIANDTTYLKTGVISPTATYPQAPTTTINDGATWLTKTGVSIPSSRLASNGSGTVIALSLGSAGTGYAISTDYGSTWAAATFPASISGVPVWCGTFFLIVNRNGGVAATTFYTSATGATGSWTSRTVPSNIFSSGVYGTQGCIITTTTTQGYITTDGITYTSITMPIAAMAGTFGNGFYVFTDPTNVNANCYKTANGSSFSTKLAPIVVRCPFTAMPAFTFGEGVFLYAQDAINAKCFTTTDFETFAISDTGIAVANDFARTFGNGTFLLTQTGAAAYTSTDLGVTWTARTIPSSADWKSTIFTGTSFAGLASSSTAATQSVSGGTYTDTAKAIFADSPENTRPFYMRVT